MLTKREANVKERVVLIVEDEAGNDDPAFGCHDESGHVEERDETGQIFGQP